MPDLSREEKLDNLGTTMTKLTREEKLHSHAKIMH